MFTASSILGIEGFTPLPSRTILTVEFFEDSVLELLAAIQRACRQADDLDPQTFVELLRAVELNQAELARLGGFNTSTVNRWCSPNVRADRLPPPRYAVMLVVQFGLLSPQGRQIVRGLAVEKSAHAN